MYYTAQFKNRSDNEKKWLYNTKIGYTLSEPKLVLEANGAGSFSFTMDPRHPYYEELDIQTTEIFVDRNGKNPAWLWSGRIIEQKVDFNGLKTFECEGELAYLTDSVQPQKIYNYKPSANSLKDWIKALLDEHNKQVKTEYGNSKVMDKTFNLGDVTAKDDTTDPAPDGGLYRNTDNSDTLSYFTEFLSGKTNGHFQITKNTLQGRFLNYLQNYPKQAKQEIKIGQNLLDYSSNFSISDLATAVIPIGDSFKYEYADDRVPEGKDSLNNVARAVIDGKTTVSKLVSEGYNRYDVECQIRELKIEDANSDSRKDRPSLEDKTREYMAGKISLDALDKDGYNKTDIEMKKRELTYSDAGLSESYNLTMSEVTKNGAKQLYPDKNKVAYIYNSANVKKYGWKCKTVNFEEVTNLTDLKKKGEKYLADQQFDSMTLEISAVDFGLINKDEDPFDLLDQVAVTSEMHGLKKKLFPISKMEISLEDPTDFKLTLGTTNSMTKGISSKLGLRQAIAYSKW